MGFGGDVVMEGIVVDDEEETPYDSVAMLDSVLEVVDGAASDSPPEFSPQFYTFRAFYFPQSYQP